MDIDTDEAVALMAATGTYVVEDFPSFAAWQQVLTEAGAGSRERGASQHDYFLNRPSILDVSENPAPGTLKPTRKRPSSGPCPPGKRSLGRSFAVCFVGCVRLLDL